jgi:hypothetical protein
MKFDIALLKNNHLVWVILGFISFFSIVGFIYFIINLLYSMVEFIKC